MEHKHYHATPIEVVEMKAAPGTAGQFTAYASTFGGVDHGGDTIQKGAFTASLKARSFRPLLWQHDMREPIGIEKSLREDTKGLIGTWELVDTQRGRDAYALLKAGAVRSMSIGFFPTKWEFQSEPADGDVTRILKEIDLLENSVVSIPMNDQAQVQSVKHAEHCDLCASIEAQKLREQQLETVEDLPDYSTLTLSKHIKLLTATADALGERTRDLLAKLESGDFSLTDSKRNDLHALLETFSRMDAVRSDAEALVQKSVPAEAAIGDSDPVPTLSVRALSIRLRQARLAARESGVEV